MHTRKKHHFQDHKTNTLIISCVLTTLLKSTCLTCISQDERPYVSQLYACWMISRDVISPNCSRRCETYATSHIRVKMFVEVSRPFQTKGFPDVGCTTHSTLTRIISPSARGNLLLIYRLPLALSANHSSVCVCFFLTWICLTRGRYALHRSHRTL
jgi:hypothetical protein